MAAATATGQTWAMPRCEDANCQRDDAEMMNTSEPVYDAPPDAPLDGALDFALAIKVLKRLHGE